MNNKKTYLALLLILFALPLIVFAAPEKPPGEDGGQGGPGGKPPSGEPGGGGSANVSYSGATTITSDTNETEKEYTSTNGSENAL